MKSFFSFVLLLFLVFPALFAQNDQKNLAKERKAILERIQKTNRLLKRTRQNKSSEVSRLNALNRQIRQRQRLINVIKQEVDLLDKATGENELVIEGMSQDLDTLKKEYSQMLYLAFKNNNSYEKLSFLFASESISQFRARIQYWRKYEEARKEQMQQINEVKKRLEARRLELDEQKAEKIQLLNTQEKERNQLGGLRQRQRNVIGQIRKKEREIKSDLTREKEVLAEINELITKYIESAAFSSTLTAEDKMISAAFAKNKGNLVWPVSDGFIASGFGLQNYLPETNKRKIQIEKLGVDIRTNPNETVFSVFTGKVVDVSQIVGRGYLVLIQHGDYFTVYSKLKSVSIQVGQKVKAKQKIGVVNTLTGKPTEVEFQIWRHRDKLNPESWLSR